MTEKPLRRIPAKPDRSGSPSELDVDVSQLAGLPDMHLEAGIHLEIDRLAARGLTRPLDALASTIHLMQGLTGELVKAYAPPIISDAQAAASDAFAAQKPVAVSKEQARAIQTLMRLQESMVKMGVVHVKIADEQNRRRGAADQVIDDMDNEDQA